MTTTDCRIIAGSVYLTADGDSLTVEEVRPGDTGAHLWVHADGEDQSGVVLAPAALRSLADDLHARANLLDPPGDQSAFDYWPATAQAEWWKAVVDATRADLKKRNQLYGQASATIGAQRDTIARLRLERNDWRLSHRDVDAELAHAKQQLHLSGLLVNVLLGQLDGQQVVDAAELSTEIVGGLHIPPCAAPAGRPCTCRTPSCACGNEDDPDLLHVAGPGAECIPAAIAPAATPRPAPRTVTFAAGTGIQFADGGD